MTTTHPLSGRGSTLVIAFISIVGLFLFFHWRSNTVPFNYNQDIPTVFENSPWNQTLAAELDGDTGDGIINKEHGKTDCQPIISDTPALSTAKVAVIIESRQLNMLVPLILHFASTLGPTWPIVFYTSTENVHYFASMPSFLRMQHQIRVEALPADTTFSTHESVSAFLTKPWFWESLAPASHVLMFQSDSIICSGAMLDVDSFFAYDFVGAPIREGLGRGYNGGLSVRNREKMLEIVKSHDWLEERHQGGKGDGYNYNYEDQWFAMRLSNMAGTSLPSEEVARTFAVETIWAENPVGYHQVTRYLASHTAEVEKWCPEIKLTVGSTFA